MTELYLFLFFKNFQIMIINIFDKKSQNACMVVTELYVVPKSTDVNEWNLLTCV